MESPKMLFYDLEVSRAVVEGYGNKWEFKVVKFVRPQQLMCYAYKWLGDKKPRFVGRHDFKTYKEFVQSLANLLNEANVVVAHNATRFDNKMSNMFFVTEHINPPSPYKTIDTLTVARSVFNFPSNSLKDLADFLELGSKESITYADLEDDYMTDRPERKTVKLMEKYTLKDVELLEKIYLVERPHMRTHPNMSVITQRPESCPRCGHDHLQARGKRYTTTAVYQQYACMNPACGAWCSERLQDKTYQKPELV